MYPRLASNTLCILKWPSNFLFSTFTGVKTNMHHQTQRWGSNPGLLACYTITPPTVHTTSPLCIFFKTSLLKFMHIALLGFQQFMNETMWTMVFCHLDLFNWTSVSVRSSLAICVFVSCYWKAFPGIDIPQIVHFLLFIFENFRQVYKKYDGIPLLSSSLFQLLRNFMELLFCLVSH